MPNRLPDRPNSLRDKARAYRSAAATDSRPERRRAYKLMAAEYDNLANVIEKGVDTHPADRTPARPAANRASRHKPN